MMRPTIVKIINKPSPMLIHIRPLVKEVSSPKKRAIMPVGIIPLIGSSMDKIPSASSRAKNDRLPLMINSSPQVNPPISTAAFHKFSGDIYLLPPTPSKTTRGGTCPLVAIYMNTRAITATKGN
jgi:hypothetical protein